MRIQRRLLEIGLLVLMAGCQTPVSAPPPQPPAPVCPEPLAPPVAADDGLKALQGHIADLHKTLLLGQGRSAAEQIQAAAQLDALASSTDPQADALKPLAALMAARLADQKRQQDSIDKLNQQLRDSQRRNEQLNEKLEALKAIEQTLPAKPGVAPR